MKKIIIISTLLCASCANNYYDYQLWSYLNTEDLKKKTIKYEGDDKIFAEYMIALLDEYGLKYIGNNTKKRADYIATTEYMADSTSGYRNIPIYGQTGINSINTNSYGTFTRGINYGSYDYNGWSTSTVNYDYGITGWQTLPYTTYATRATFIIKKYDPKEKIEDMKTEYKSTIFINSSVSRPTIMSYLAKATQTFGKPQEYRYLVVDCYYDEYRNITACEEPQGFFTNIINLITGK